MSDWNDKVSNVFNAADGKIVTGIGSDIIISVAEAAISEEKKKETTADNMKGIGSVISDATKDVDAEISNALSKDDDQTLNIPDDIKDKLERIKRRGENPLKPVTMPTRKVPSPRDMDPGMVIPSKPNTLPGTDIPWNRDPGFSIPSKPDTFPGTDIPRQRDPGFDGSKKRKTLPEIVDEITSGDSEPKNRDPRLLEETEAQDSAPDFD